MQEVQLAFPWGSPGPLDLVVVAYGRSATRRRTLRRKLRIAAGYHPLRPGKIDPDPAHRCGNCFALRRALRNGRRWYWKCTLIPESHGPATDVVKRWPGCSAWTASGRVQ